MNHLENTIGKAAQPGLQPPVRRAAIWAPLLAVCFVALLIVLGAWRHVQIRAELEQDAKDNAVVTVNVVTVKPDEKPRELILPGNVQAFQSTSVYARTDGYLARWLVDIGDHVEKGQLLAEIETPEIDKEFEQARAQVAQAQSNERIAKVTADRWQYLAQRNVVAKEENDVNQAAYQTSAATLAAAQANLERLEQLEDFKKIAAPFAGTITARQRRCRNARLIGRRHVGDAVVQSRADSIRCAFSFTSPKRMLRPFEQESPHAFSCRNIRRGISRAAWCAPRERSILPHAPCSRSWKFRITTVRCLPECTRKLSSPCRKQTRRSSFLRTPLSSGPKALKLR